jgi:hypothetical protein
MDFRLMSFGSLAGNNKTPDCIDKSVDDRVSATATLPLKSRKNDNIDVISTVVKSASDDGILAAASSASTTSLTIMDDASRSDALTPKFTKVVNLVDYINADTIEAGTTTSLSRDEHIALNIATVKKNRLL